MGLSVRKLRRTDGRALYEMLQELPPEENGFLNPVHGMTFEEYRDWLKRSAESAERVGAAEDGEVPTTTFWLFEDGRPAGIGRVRHCLTDALRERGGNIGYAVRPSARGRGLGKYLLSRLIAESRKIGVGRLLLTIQNHNIASIRVGLANGGKIEKITADRHYLWIEP